MTSVRSGRFSLASVARRLAAGAVRETVHQEWDRKRVWRRRALRRQPEMPLPTLRSSG